MNQKDYGKYASEYIEYLRFKLPKIRDFPYRKGPRSNKGKQKSMKDCLYAN